jgi:hypothetical protein
MRESKVLRGDVTVGLMKRRQFIITSFVRPTKFRYVESLRMLTDSASSRHVGLNHRFRNNDEDIV